MEAREPLEDVPTGPTESPGLLATGTWQASGARLERVDLPGGVRAPQSARRALEQHVAGGITRDVLASIELLTTELVSNAVRHGGATEDETVALHLAITPALVRVEVWDEGSGFDPGTPAPYGEGGYGLFLVSEVATRWGVERDSGNCAWFELEL